MINKNVSFWFLVSILFLLNSCGTQRLFRKHSVPQAANEIQAVLKAQPDFQNMYVRKASLRVNLDGRNMSMTGRIQVIPDSIVVLTVQPFFGIELFRLNCYPDRVEVINKVKHQYAVVDYTYLSKKTGIPIDFSLFEAVFSNHLFLTQGTKTKNLIRAFEIEKSNDTTTLLSKTKIYGLKHRFYINSDKRIVRTKIGKPEDTQFEIEFSEFEWYDGFSFPRVIHANSKADKKDIKVRIQIKSIDFNTTKGIQSLKLLRYKPTSIDKIGSLL